jgi:AGZA family xanthine/uracil permease-like MFS transporter
MGIHSMGWVDSKFQLSERGTTPGREVLGGVTTFMALSYIIFVQPTLMAIAGVPIEGAFIATCVASAIACVLMGLLANYPIALAPAMGHNVFFTFVVVNRMGYDWRQALAAVFIGGCVFVALSFVGFRAKLMDIIPDSLKRAIAGGIGLLITFVGLEYAGLIVGSPDTGIALGRIHSPVVLLALFGLVATLCLMGLGVRGAVLWGIVLMTGAGLILTMRGVTVPTGEDQVPLLSLDMQSYASLDPRGSLFALDFDGLFRAEGFLAVVLTFLFLDVFDTVGTLIGVSDRAGLLDSEGRLPKARWALFSDAAGTVVGASMGTSTVTSYVESAAGVQAGARTGLANLVTAAMFLLSILLYPVLAVVATRHEFVGGFESAKFRISQYPVLAPALIVVGSMMLKGLARLDWDDATEFLPAFLVVIMIPFSLSITEGIAMGFIAYSLLKFVTGRWREAHWAFHVMALVLVLRYVFIPPVG